MSENREVKSDVFSMLMEDKRYALQLYNALKGSDYRNPDIVEMQKLEKGISLSVRNDAAFIVDMNLEIYEHQSTYNPNMPLRSLIYVAEIIKKSIRNTDLFKRRVIMLPTPHFVVFYNGREERPATETLRLSDAFEDRTVEPMLELICTVYNINPGKNDELLDKCGILMQYTQFIEKVREYENSELEEPIKSAIEWCVENDILTEFLLTRGQEVTKAMTIDMTWERREQLIRRDEREEGRKEGKEEGRKEGRKEGSSVLIKNMSANGLSVEKIAQLCSLSPDEVKALL